MSHLGLKPKQVAGLLNVSRQCLYKWRQRGRGPSFISKGTRVFYPEESFQEWQDVEKKRNSLDAIHAAKLIGVKRQTLRKWQRAMGAEGPPCIVSTTKGGRRKIRYDQAELESWVERAKKSGLIESRIELQYRPSRISPVLELTD